MANLSSGHAAGFRYPRQVIGGAAAAVPAYTHGVVCQRQPFCTTGELLIIEAENEH